jgi:hypothetical protein
MTRTKRVRVSEKLLRELLDSCYSLLLHRYRTEDMDEFFAPADPAMKQAKQALQKARRRGLLPTGYEDAPEHVLDKPLRLRKPSAYTPVIEVIWNLPHKTVNGLIRQHFKVDGYDCANDWGNDHIQCLTVSLKYYGRQARRRVARYESDNFNEEPSLEELLCELARCGVLPEGNYEVWVDG